MCLNVKTNEWYQWPSNITTYHPQLTLGSKRKTSSLRARRQKRGLVQSRDIKQHVWHGHNSIADLANVLSVDETKVNLQSH